MLLFTDASPFARKCRLVIAELGADKDIELRDIGAISPIEPNDIAFAHGPLAKIPILIRPGDTALFDSGVICDFINHLWKGEFFPAEGEPRWCALRLQALGDGLMEAAIAVRYDISFRGNTAEGDPWHHRQKARILASVDALHELTGELALKPTIGSISVACALGYLDLRFPDFDWRMGRKPLDEWFRSFSARPSMMMTKPNSDT